MNKHVNLIQTEIIGNSKSPSTLNQPDVKEQISSNKQELNRIVIHVGLSKTGTTYLQKTLFPELPQVEVVEGWHSHRKLMKSSLKNNIIISDEEISGWLWQGSGFQDFYPNIKKIKSIYRDPKIIFGIRNHLGFIISVYKQYLHEKGHHDFDYLFNLENNGLIKHDDLLLMPRINFLKDNFEDVFIYSQESLIKRQDDFMVALNNFLGIDSNLKPTKQKRKRSNEGVKSLYQVNTLKRLNKINYHLEHLHPRLSLYSVNFNRLGITPRNICQHHLKNIKSEKFDISQRYKDFINEHYASDWQEAVKHISY